MKKLQLFDCCGAYHVHNFNRSPTESTFIPLWDSRTFREVQVSVPALQALELFSAPTRAIEVQGYPAHQYLNNRSPGLLSAILTRRQNRVWASHLRRLGWQLVVNNIRNQNSYNQLFSWVKISNHASMSGRSYRFVSDGSPYTGVVRDLGGGTFARVRRSPGAPLEHIEVIEAGAQPLVVQG